MKTPLPKILGYAIGDGAVSLSMNGISNFALLYYTQVLGLGPSYAGLALSITIIWDAISDPIMGHISDNTQSRFGRRHPFILVGGLLLAVSFFFLWFVPSGAAQPGILFWYLLSVNLVVRTAVTVFIVPFTALGFEICTDYDDRSRLQSVRAFLNQLVNFGGGALAWVLFFQDGVAADGSRIDGTKLVGNYFTMSLWLTGAIVVFVLLSTFFTREYAKDNRQTAEAGGSVRAFFVGVRDIATDPFGRYVISSKFIIQLGIMFTAQIQMFTYVEFMLFTAREKTIAHGAGMLAFAAGSLFHAWLVKRFDKKQTAFIGMAISALGNGMLFFLFIGEVIEPQAVWALSAGVEVPIALLAFAVFQGMWWGGMGILAPLMLSMIADISEINYVRTGKLRDGSYSAIFSFFTKAAVGVGMFLNGWLMEFAGYVSGAPEQTESTLRNLAIITFVAGPIAILPLIPILKKYPVDRAFMNEIKRKRAEMEADSG